MKNAALEITIPSVPAFFCPEMGDKKPELAQIIYKVSYGGGYYLTVEDDSVTLSGRGIRMSGDGSDHRRGKKTYHVTEAAFKKIEKQYICCFESQLD